MSLLLDYPELPDQDRVKKIYAHADLDGVVCAYMANKYLYPDTKIVFSELSVVPSNDVDSNTLLLDVTTHGYAYSRIDHHASEAPRVEYDLNAYPYSGCAASRLSELLEENGYHLEKKDIILTACAEYIDNVDGIYIDSSCLDDMKKPTEYRTQSLDSSELSVVGEILGLLAIERSPLYAYIFLSEIDENNISGIDNLLSSLNNSDRLIAEDYLDFLSHMDGYLSMFDNYDVIIFDSRKIDSQMRRFYYAFINYAYNYYNKQRAVIAIKRDGCSISIRGSSDIFEKIYTRLDSEGYIKSAGGRENSYGIDLNKELDFDTADIGKLLEFFGFKNPED